MWQERFLTREGLVARVEGEIGKACFGVSAWKDTFSRDMRVVKRALQAAGYQLVYRRSQKRRGYEILNQPPVSDELAKILAGATAEVDPAQIAVLRSLQATERFRLGSSMSDTARIAVSHRIHRRDPVLSQVEANRRALKQET